MELARQSILIRELFDDFRKKNPVTDEAAKVEYDKFKAQATGTEYRARHILVEKEDEAKALLAQLKAGAKFEDLAKKHSKDPGSGQNGGDLDFAKPDSLRARVRQGHGRAEEGRDDREPVKSQFGYHIIRLDDTREASFPAFDDVKGQIKQRLEQQACSSSRKNCAPRPRPTTSSRGMPARSRLSTMDSSGGLTGCTRKAATSYRQGAQECPRPSIPT
jgi:peptidyl-prolyl cis-trans isomerase C